MLRRIAAASALVLTAAAVPALSTGSPAGAAPDDSPFRTAAAVGTASELTGDKVRVRPDHYTTVTVDVAGIRDALRHAPAAGRSTSYQTFRVPTPNGGTERFAVQRTQLMESELASAHPEIGTWAGKSLDHRGTTIALDVTPMGFHASVRGPFGQDAWYVDPAYNRPGTTTHLAYYGAAVGTTEQQQFVERETREITNAVAQRDVQAKKSGKRVSQRLYRLALTSDPSYAKYFGTENVLAEKVTLINRVNQIYNDDLAIELRLINETDKLNLDTDAEATGANGPCGAHPCFDPANPSDPNSFSQLEFCDVPTLGRNRTVLGQLVGASSYDIGHLVLGVNGGGVAYLGVVGWDFKGGGCTGLPDPVGDFFAIDYVAHEMGHQFSGNHTFNGVQYACSGSNRNPGASVEPGSGSSVMAYAGICLQDDLQSHTDPYFSQRTIKEVTGYTSAPTNPVTEVQTVSLRNFDTDGEQITLSFPGAPGSQTLTRGSTYNVAGIEAAVETLTGRNVTIAGWGYDPYDTFTAAVAPLTLPDDTGFQVIFAPSPDPEVYGGASDVPSLVVGSPSAGVSGFTGETATGGPADNEGERVATRNHAPRAKAPRSVTIPMRTPFRLRGHGSDSDHDRLTFLWEQNDTGGREGTSLVDNHKVDGPLFRVFGTRARVTDTGTLETPSPNENKATRNGTRYFPDMAQVLSGNTNARTGACPEVKPLPPNLDDYKPVKPRIVECYSEFLPTRDYQGRARSKTPKLHFRLTVRDGYPTGGGTAHDDVTVKIDPTAGPFLVTSQAEKSVSVNGGGAGVVTWKVARTRHLAPSVRILVSTNAGRTWRVVTARTANDGSAAVRWPNASTGAARVMVQSLGNYFFAVNRREFQIR
jgi:hypothetical protein